MLRCKEVIRLLESGEELASLKKARLHVHYFLCEGCSRYLSQLKLMKKTLKGLLMKLTKVEENEIRMLEETILQKITKTHH